MHTVFALLCFVVVIHWLIFPYPSGLLHWHCGNLTIAPVPAKQPWWMWINSLCEFIMNDCITKTKQSTTKPCAYFLGYTVWKHDITEKSHGYHGISSYSPFNGLFDFLCKFTTKKTSKHHTITGPFRVESTSDQCIPLTGPPMWKVFSCNDVIPIHWLYYIAWT